MIIVKICCTTNIIESITEQWFFFKKNIKYIGYAEIIIYLANKYLLSTYCVLGPDLGLGI